MIKVHGSGDAGLLVEIEQIGLQFRVIDEAPPVAFEMTVIDGVEADEAAKSRKSVSTIRKLK